MTDSLVSEASLATATASVPIEQMLSSWHRFANKPKWIELQALKVRGERSNYERSRYAHADSVASAAQLAKTADAWDCPAVYLIANQIQDAVTSRAKPGEWHDASKGEGTSDAEIAKRSVLFIDIDARRPKGTSATNEELSHTVTAASLIYDELVGLLEDPDYLALGASGNGRAVLIALNDLPIEEAGKLHHATLIALAGKYTNPRVEIDRVVHDAKRLIPCWGTRKKKGARGNADRPHRRTAFVCAEEIKRATLSDLERIVASLRTGLGDDSQREIDRALGVKAPPPAPRPTTPSVTPRQDGESPFKRANETPIADVLRWLGLYESDRAVCPGCGLSDAGVAIVGNGIKCSHARCAGKGVRAGYRTPVDAVAESRGLSPSDAVSAMADRFGFAGFAPRTETRTPIPVAAVEQPPLVPPTLSRMSDAFDAAEKMLDAGPQPNPLRTGFDELDMGLKRLGPREFTMLAADSGIGKSTIATQIALHVANAGHGVVYLNLEMSEEMYGLRTAANFTKIATQKAAAHQLSHAEFDSLKAGFGKLRMPASRIILGNRKAHRQIPAIKSFVAQAAAALANEGHPLKLIVVDHILQVLVTAKNDKDAEGKQRSDLLKDLGEANDCHVLALVHVTREGSKTGSMPTKNQLASSAWFDRDPDNILVFHQKRAADGTFSKEDNAQLSCQKARWGEPFAVELKYMHGFFYPWSLEQRFRSREPVTSGEDTLTGGLS